MRKNLFIKMRLKTCACNKQIVWWFGRLGTILACKNCEIIFFYDVKKCPYCDEEVTEFREVEK